MQARRIVLVSAVALALAACGQKAEEPAKSAAAPEAAGETVVKIGHAAPLSGPIGHIGKDTEYGAQIALDEVNAEGLTIGGKKVKFELVSEDDQGDPKAATQVAQRFVDQNVAGVVGHLTSGPTVTASKIYADAGIPQITPSSTNPAYTAQGFKSAFRLIADDAQQGKAIANYVVNKLGMKKLAIIDDRTAYGQGLADEFEKAAKALGADIVKREFTNDKATDFAAILTSIKGVAPDAIFYGGMDAQGGPMARQIQKLGLKAKLIGGDGLYSPEFLKLAGDAAEGQYSTQAGAPKEQQPGYASFAEKLKAKYKQEIQMYATYSYDSAKVMVEAMKKANSTEPAKYLPELAKTNYDGATGHIEFDEKGDRKNAAVTVYQVKGGKWDVVDVVGGSANAAPQQGK